MSAPALSSARHVARHATTRDRLIARLRPPRMSRRTVAHLGALLLMFTVVALASARDRVGDGGEYMAMTFQMAHGHLPSITGAQWPGVASALDRLGHDYGVFAVDNHGLAPNERADFVHFWFYSLLAVPAYWLTSAVGLDATWAFFLLNCALLGSALTVLYRDGARPLVLTIVALSPTLWWLAPAHTEVFTYSCIVVALTWARRRPVAAIAVAAVASTQNIPLLALAGMIWVLWVIDDRRSALAPRNLVRLVPALAVAALAPLYYLIRIGSVSILASSGATEGGMHSVRKLLAPVLDLNLGLIPQDPGWVILIALALGVPALRRGADLRLCLVVVVPSLLVFVWSFAETPNVNHGGTPGMSRYALWIIALAVPLMRGFDRISTRFERLTAGLAVTTFVAATVSTYWPGLPSASLTPTPVAAYVWDHHPGWDNPYPEVFFERITQLEKPMRSIATDSCSKVLVLDGRWPGSCRRPATALPTSCADTGDTCYANRDGRGYDFVTVSRR